MEKRLPRGEHEFPLVRDRKRLHEAIHGTHVFEPHEVAVLDTPLLQRLGQIHQTGLAALTYRTAVHSRFSHTLGVTVLATRFLTSLAETCPDEEIDVDSRKGDLAHVRMACLLHDCGHGLCSHVSEEIYKWDNELRALLEETPEYAGCKAHEVLSYFIVTSKPFEEWFQEGINGRYSVDIDLKRVAEAILGKSSDPDRRYQADIVNGPFDADKLDYIHRDGRFAGLGLTLDLDRILSTSSIAKVTSYEDRQQRRLVASAPSPIEQLLVSKMSLYSQIYHHHKVLAADSMLRSIVEYARDNAIEIAGNPLQHPVDFLEMTDWDLFSTATASACEAGLGERIQRFLHRRLLKRAIAICKESVDNFDGNLANELTRMVKGPGELRKFRGRVHDALPCDLKKKLTIHDIQLSIPESPSLREGTQTLVRAEGSEHTLTLDDFFPTQDWLEAYADRKWRAYVFCPPEWQKEVHQASQDVLGAEPFSFKFNKFAGTMCHIGES